MWRYWTLNIYLKIKGFKASLYNKDKKSTICLKDVFSLSPSLLKLQNYTQKLIAILGGEGGGLEFLKSGFESLAGPCCPILGLDNPGILWKLDSDNWGSLKADPL